MVCHTDDVKEGRNLSKLVEPKTAFSKASMLMMLKVLIGKHVCSHKTRLHR